MKTATKDAEKNYPTTCTAVEEQIINKGISKIYEQNSYYLDIVLQLRMIKGALTGNTKCSEPDGLPIKAYGGILDRLYDAVIEYKTFNIEALDLVMFIRDKPGEI